MFRAALVTSAVAALLLTACGSSEDAATTAKPSLSAHDVASFRTINRAISNFRTLEDRIGRDAIAGSSVGSAEEFIRRNTSRVRRANRAADELRLAVAQLDDTKAASLYTPLSIAVQHTASDLTLFLNSVKDGTESDVRSAYGKLQADETRMNDVVAKNYPKVLAYAKTLG